MELRRKQNPPVEQLYSYFSEILNVKAVVGVYTLLEKRVGSAFVHGILFLRSSKLDNIRHFILLE